LAANQVVIARRDKGPKEKQTVSFEGLKETILDLLKDIQRSMFNDALKFREENSHRIDTYDEFKDMIENQLGFLYAHCLAPQFVYAVY
jgi:prolyl-tRNA synthetase